MADLVDELEIQMPGRLVSLQIVATLLLHQHPQAVTIGVEAESALARIERGVLNHPSLTAHRTARAIFAAARANLGKILTDAEAV